MRHVMRNPDMYARRPRAQRRRPNETRAAAAAAAQNGASGNAGNEPETTFSDKVAALGDGMSTK